MATTHTHTDSGWAGVHPVNALFVPRLPYDNLPTGGTANDGYIVRRYVGDVLTREIGVSAARNELFTYRSGRAMLAAFDRWLLDCLLSCGDRPAPFIP